MSLPRWNLIVNSMSIGFLFLMSLPINLPSAFVVLLNLPACLRYILPICDSIRWSSSTLNTLKKNLYCSSSRFQLSLKSFLVALNGDSNNTWASSCIIPVNFSIPLTFGVAENILNMFLSSFNPWYWTMFCPPLWRIVIFAFLTTSTTSAYFTNISLLLSNSMLRLVIFPSSLALIYLLLSYFLSI